MILLLVYALAVVLGWDYAPALEVREAGPFAAIFSFLATMFLSIADIVIKVVRAITPIFSRVFSAMNFVVSRVGAAAGRFFRAIAGGLRGVWDAVIKPVATALGRWFDRFKKFLDRVFAPIREALEWVNRLLDKVWNKVISPVLDAIQKIRLVLKLLAELGVPFAEKLEGLLALLETRIYESFREVRTFVNNFSSWLDLLLDPRGWIRSTPFLLTVWRYGGNIVNLIEVLGLDVRTQATARDFRDTHRPEPLSDSVKKLKAGFWRERGYARLAVAELRTKRAGLS